MGSQEWTTERNTENTNQAYPYLGDTCAFTFTCRGDAEGGGVKCESTYVRKSLQATCAA